MTLTFLFHDSRINCHYWPVRSLAVMELSRLSCWSVVVSSLPPPPAPEHTEEELSTANPSASSTSLSIRSLDAMTHVSLLEGFVFPNDVHFYHFTRVHRVKSNAKKTQECDQLHRIFYHLRYAGIAAVLFLSEPILLHEEVKALRLFPHVVKCYTFCYCSCCDLRKKKNH